MPLNSSTVALCTEYSIKSFGGTEALVGALIRGLSPHCRIVLVSNDESEAIEGSEFSSLIQVHIPWRPEVASRQAARKLAQQLRTQQVHLAHFHFGGNYGWGSRIAGQSPIEFARRLGIRCVTTVHSFDSILDGYCGPQKPLWIKLALLPAAWLGKVSVLARIDAEIAVSRENYGRLRAWYWPMRARFRHIYHSRLGATPPSKPAVARHQIILSVGHIAFRKGQHVLAQAFAQIARDHPQWKLRMIGELAEPSCHDKIRRIVDKNDLTDRVEIPGARRDILDFMQHAAVFAQPSMFEGLGLALQEALWNGCACVGTRVGGIPELIDDGANGLLVSAGNADELAAALERLISDDSLRQMLSARAPRSIIEKGMTAEQMVDDHLKLYESIIDGH
jgi:glycosyltransferase involved in cell wall biosynthesis